MKMSEDSKTPGAELAAACAKSNRDQLNELVSAGNANMELFSRVNQIALRAAHTMALRQSTALQESFDELGLLMRVISDGKEHTKFGETQHKCTEISIERAFEHIKAAIDPVQEMNDAVFAAMTEHLQGLIPASDKTVSVNTNQKPRG